ncbi:MAG: nucleotidyltransferase family protein [Chloroflexi bacterium]|nr:MAG: nucleotidyltransferase family protein [Chloroflexota bacterium]
MKAVILAGGKGTRLAPYTIVFPKPLMPLDDMPILEVVIRQLSHYGFKDITMAVGHLAELIMAYFSDGSQFGVKIQYSREDVPLGTAGPLSLIPDLNEPFIVMNGDVLTTLNFAELYRYHRQRGGIATIAMHRRSVNIDLGVIKHDVSNRIVDYIEKPTYHYQVSMGIYVFDPHVLTYIPGGERLDFPELVLRLLQAGETVIGYPYDGYWLDIGRTDDYAQASEEFGKLRHLFLPEE